MANWMKRAGFPNEILQGDGFIISYNPDTTNGPAFFAGDGAETALRDERNGRGRCLVLNGDWRKQFEELVPMGYNACLALYKELAVKHRSSWSEDWED